MIDINDNLDLTLGNTDTCGSKDYCNLIGVLLKNHRKGERIKENLPKFAK